MADITKSASACAVDLLYKKPESRQAGAEIATGDAVYIDTNGRFLKAVTSQQLVSGTFGTIYKFDGLALKAIPSGTFGEIGGRGVEFHYADSGLTIGGSVYVSATAGKLADAPVAANDNPVAIVRSATTIELIRGVG
jgi:hypothetical protein